MKKQIAVVALGAGLALGMWSASWAQAAGAGRWNRRRYRNEFGQRFGNGFGQRSRLDGPLHREPGNGRRQ